MRNFRSPSIARLREIFGNDAAEAKRILRMSRAELEELPAGDERLRECYHPPKTWDLRMHCLNALGDSFYGVESLRLNDRDDSYIEYLNAGDAYAPTLVRFHGNYYVACWGDYVEGYGSSEQ